MFRLPRTIFSNQLMSFMKNEKTTTLGQYTQSHVFSEGSINLFNHLQSGAWQDISKTLRMCEFYDSAILLLGNFPQELIGQLSKDICVRMFVAGWFT